MQIGQRLVVLDTTGEESGTICTDIVVVKKKLGEETLILKRLGKCRNRCLRHLGVCQSDDSKGLNICEAFRNFNESFILNRIIIQVQLAQLELVRKHFTES